jgi:hypothetical protein
MSFASSSSVTVRSGVARAPIGDETGVANSAVVGEFVSARSMLGLVISFSLVGLFPMVPSLTGETAVDAASLAGVLGIISLSAGARAGLGGVLGKVSGNGDGSRTSNDGAPVACLLGGNDGGSFCGSLRLPDRGGNGGGSISGLVGLSAAARDEG